jgi:hypothetical protein
MVEQMGIVRILNGGPGSGKTENIKQQIAYYVGVDNVQCIVFSLYGEYDRECRALCGTNIPVTEDFAFAGLPDSRMAVYSFSSHPEEGLNQAVSLLFRKVMGAIQEDSTRPRFLALDINQSVFNDIQNLYASLLQSIGQYNASVIFAFQGG